MSPRAEQVAVDRDVLVGRQPAQVTHQLRVNVDQLRAVPEIALFEVDQSERAFLQVQVARAEAQDLGNAPAGLPQRFEQQAVSGCLSGVDDGARLVRQDV